MQIHADQKPDRMQEERANEQNNGSLSECFRPFQPREKGEYKDNDVENHCLKERLRPVEQVLEPRSRRLLRNRSVKVLIIFLDDPVESLRGGKCDPTLTGIGTVIHYDRNRRQSSPSHAKAMNCLQFSSPGQVERQSNSCQRPFFASGRPRHCGKRS